ncbi:MAG: LamG domain-containing protein [Kiritimatiellia bacterium]
MKQLIAILLSAMGLALVSQAQTSEVLRVMLDLEDGSRVIGTPACSSFPLQTSYAKVEVPLARIAQVSFLADHETVSVQLVNGDLLTGVLNRTPLELTTLFGKAAVPMNQIRSLQISAGVGFVLPPQLKKNLVLHFAFDKDEKERVIDASEKKNDGQVRGATWLRQGHRGGAMQFDGVANHIFVANSDSLVMPNLTLSAWICPADLAKANNMIMEKRPHDGCWELMHFDQGRMLLRGASPATQCTEQGVIEAGKWMHVVGTINGAQGVIYVNGVRVQITPVVPVPVTSGEVLIGAGRSWSNADDQFKGLLDDVMIFDRALSGEEVRQLYNLQK